MKDREKLYAKLSSAFLRKWWFVVAISVLFIYLLSNVIALKMKNHANYTVHRLGNTVNGQDESREIIVKFARRTDKEEFLGHKRIKRELKQIVIKDGTQTFERWAKPPVVPVISIYFYNVTNADEFLNNGSKPIVDEIGPYRYKETWERKNIKFNENGTVTYHLQKIFVFDEENSAGMEDDLIVVPNISMLSATSQAKHADRFLRLAMANIMDILKIKPFVEVSVGQLLWGYKDPLLKLAREVLPKGHEVPDEVFGLMYNKNGTSPDKITIFTGANDITKYGLMDTFNGKSHLSHWLTDECNSLLASDGSIFPPQITKNRTLHIYEKDLCRTLPLKFEKEVERKDKVPSWRFSPPEDVFGSITENPDNFCFCRYGPPCSPSGLFNVTLCRLDSSLIMLSFPHFYLANDSYRTAFEGISPPDPEKHKFYMDVQPLMGTAMSAKGRIQINLAVSQVVDIKQVATFPDIVFPILWFEESIDGLPDEVTGLMRLATEVPPVAHATITGILFVLGVILLIIAVWRLVRGANRLSSLHLATGHVGQPTQSKDMAMSNRR